MKFLLLGFTIIVFINFCFMCKLEEILLLIVFIISVWIAYIVGKQVGYKKGNTKGYIQGLLYRNNRR